MFFHLNLDLNLGWDYHFQIFMVPRVIFYEIDQNGLLRILSCLEGMSYFLSIKLKASIYTNIRMLTNEKKVQY